MTRLQFLLEDFINSLLSGEFFSWIILACIVFGLIILSNIYRYIKYRYGRHIKVFLILMVLFVVYGLYAMPGRIMHIFNRVSDGVENFVIMVANT